MLLGFLAGGLMHARMLAATLAHDTQTDTDARRIREADAYGVYHLSRVAGLAEVVAAGEIA